MYCLGGAQIDLGAMSKQYNGREYPGHYGGGDYFSFLNKMSNTRQMNLLAISLRVTLMYDDQHIIVQLSTLHSHKQTPYPITMHHANSCVYSALKKDSISSLRLYFLHESLKDKAH